MRLVPDTLFGRLLAALLGVAAVALALIVTLIVREREDLAFRGSTAADVVRVVAQTSAALAALPRDARTDELQRLQREHLRLSGPPARSVTADRAGDRAMARLLGRRLRNALGNGYRVAVRPARFDDGSSIRIDFGQALTLDADRGSPQGRERPPPDGSRGAPNGTRDAEARGGRLDPSPPSRFEGPGGAAGRPPRGVPRFGVGAVELLVTLPDGDNVAFRTPLPPAEPPLPRMIFAELGLLTLALGVVLFFMAKTITRPLSELARAADAAGRGMRFLPLAETGSRELRDATHAFNVMQERLQRYLESRTRVLAAMSHDLRTPLTRLKLRAEMLDDESLRARFTADLDEMSAMVNGALDLFRGLNEDEPMQAVQLGVVLEQLAAEFAEAGAAFDVGGSTDQQIVARPQQLKRALTNLLTNAVKYGSRAQLVVEDDASALVLRVLDDGPGIPPPLLEQVFEPFYRLESSRNAQTGGVGLGLGIARDIAQAHGGTLELRNRVPHGLEAILRLPKARPAAIR